MNEKTRNMLDRIRRMATSDADAVTMILSYCSDMGSADGCLISGRRFDMAAEMIVSYFREERSDG